MKRLILIALVCLGASPALAIDCAKAGSPSEKLICGDRRLLKADSALGKAYQALLAKAADAELRAWLTTSQKRWLKARDAAAAPNEDQPDRAAILLRVIEARTGALLHTQNGQFSLITWGLKQRGFLAKFSGGAFAGYDTSCDVLPRDNGYACFAIRHYQNGDRVCSIDEFWASGTVYTKRFVADVMGGKPKLKASCDYNGNDNLCPDAGTANAGWNLQPKATERLYSSVLLPKLDGDIDDGDNTEWLTACLTQPDYPAK